MGIDDPVSSGVFVKEFLDRGLGRRRYLKDTKKATLRFVPRRNEMKRRP